MRPRTSEPIRMRSLFRDELRRLGKPGAIGLGPTRRLCDRRSGAQRRLIGRRARRRISRMRREKGRQIAQSLAQARQQGRRQRRTRAAVMATRERSRMFGPAGCRPRHRRAPNATISTGGAIDDEEHPLPARPSGGPRRGRLSHRDHFGLGFYPRGCDMGAAIDQRRDRSWTLVHIQLPGGTRGDLGGPRRRAFVAVRWRRDGRGVG